MSVRNKTLLGLGAVTTSKHFCVTSPVSQTNDMAMAQLFEVPECWSILASARFDNARNARQEKITSADGTLRYVFGRIGGGFWMSEMGKGDLTELITQMSNIITSATAADFENLDPMRLGIFIDVDGEGEQKKWGKVVLYSSGLPAQREKDFVIVGPNHWVYFFARM
jgi:hypothetical protein